MPPRKRRQSKLQKAEGDTILDHSSEQHDGGEGQKKREGETRKRRNRNFKPESGRTEKHDGGGFRRSSRTRPPANYKPPAQIHQTNRLEKRSANLPEDVMGRVRVLGGGVSSQAGDAMIIQMNKSRVVHITDSGAGTTRKEARSLLADVQNKAGKLTRQDSFGRRDHESLLSEPPEPLKLETHREDRNFTVISTHKHGDHLADTEAQRSADLVFGGQEGGLIKKSTNTKKLEPSDNGTLLRRWEMWSGDREDSKAEPRARFSLNAIVPPEAEPSKIKNDANVTSLGEVLSVQPLNKEGEADADIQPFRYYNLGDMTREAIDNVTEVFTNVGQKRPADVLNLPHHGSSNNFAAVPAGLIGPNTRILVSGWTQNNPVGELLAWVKDWGGEPSQVVFLLDSDKVQTPTTAAGALSKQSAPIKLKPVQQSGARIARDFLIDFDLAGKPVQTLEGELDLSGGIE